MNSIDFKFKLVDIFWSIFLLSEKNKTKPKNKVVHAIISKFLIRSMISVEYNMYPKIIRGTEPIKIKTKSLWLFFKFNKSLLK